MNTIKPVLATHQSTLVLQSQVNWISDSCTPILMHISWCHALQKHGTFLSNQLCFLLYLISISWINFGGRDSSASRTLD